LIREREDVDTYMSAVELVKVSKNYGLLPALKDISLTVDEGEAVAFLGPNGAGKSTLLRIVASQIRPTSGDIRVLGHSLSEEPLAVKRMVGLVGHKSFLYDELTVEENLRYYGRFFDATSDDIDRVIKVTDLQRWRDFQNRHLSHGLKKRADIARAMLGRSRILVLDEIFSGLDQASSDNLIEHLTGSQGLTILVSSHSLELVRRLCDRGIHLRGGEIEKDVTL